MLAALASAPFIFVNSFFAPQVLAAPAIASITYISGTIPAPNAVYAREEVVFTANVTEGAGLVYVWSFGDGESAIGDAGNSGRVAHRYDRAFASVSFVTRPTLRLYSGTAEAASRSMDITVQVARLPANAASLSAAEQAALPDTWPFANITRADGPGPYLPGSAIDFRANESVRGTALSQWDASTTFQWTILDASGVKAKEASVSIATEPTGAFNFSSPATGWYVVTLRANQLNGAGGGFVPVYDTSTHAFSVVDGAPASAPFSLSLAGPAISTIDLTPSAEPFATQNYRADATVTGGVVPFTYIWNYPNDLQVGDDPDFNTPTVTTNDSTNRLNATFNRSGVKNIYLTVVDATFRKQTATLTYTIRNSASGVTPFSPTLNIGATPSPLSVALVEANNKSFAVQVGTGLTPPAQTFVFRATASNGTPPYQIQLSANNRTATPCTTTPTAMQCEYAFNAYGTFPVVATVVDGSTPAQEESFTRNVVIQQEGASAGTGTGTGTGGTGTGTGGAGTGGTGSGGISTGATAASTPLDPRASKYGLASAFSRVGIGQSDDLKSSIATIINIVLGFLGIIAVIFIIFGGFRMMTAAGNEDQTASGKQAIVAGAIGLLIIFAAWGIAAFVINNLASATA